jgi:cyclic beta-1,2-glucan synthetase
MVTDAGSGYSRWRDLAVTRWREDVTRDVGGAYIFLRDADSGACWSAGYQPLGGTPESYAVSFTEDRAEIVRRDGSMETRLEVIVSPEDDAEVRRVSLTNQDVQIREIELTSYAEVVLTLAAADGAHPAFSNLFVRTEWVADRETLLATRRRRTPEEAELWMAHVVIVDGETVGAPQWETGRAQFLGRGHGIQDPVSVIDGRPLSNTVGPVLDPIVSLRRRVRLLPGHSARVTFTTLVAPSRQAALDLADKYRRAAAFERTATLASTHAQAQLHHLGLGVDEAQLFQSLTGAILYSDRTLRAAAAILTRQTGGQAALWAHGISGDRPIVLVEIGASEEVELVRQLLNAQAYWRTKCLAIDLVILNDQILSEAPGLQGVLETLVRASQSAAHGEGDKSLGGVFILTAAQVTAQQRDVLASAARAVLSGRRGSLAEQVASANCSVVLTDSRSRRLPATTAQQDPPELPPALDFFNGLGGFTSDGREYVTILDNGRRTPAPWINVIANAGFGFQVSESGSGYTWCTNSQENQLTPWSNDAACDPPGETLYVRDEETGELWGPTALPIREEDGRYVCRHGTGYSRFEHASRGISLECLQFVPLDDPVKISRLTLTNHSGRPRRLSVTAYVEWVLGVSRGSSKRFIVTELDDATNAMFARNPWSRDFAGHVAFADLGGAQSAWTGDRTEFLGRNGNADRPAALEPDARLTGLVGADLDPCSALQCTIELPVDGHVDVIFVLGQAATREEAQKLIVRYRTADLDASLRSVVTRWEETLGTVQVTTPDGSLNLMLNRWLLYQTLACRVWARSAFYQASGAYGFRDQLQDVMALSVSRPEVAREHVLRAAARQFGEGDVQHWWHPPVGRGVRTRISDDLLWLPYVVHEHLLVSGDTGLLNELIPFLTGPILAVGESDSYFEPQVSAERATLFEHCARAIDRSLQVGSHGLPLMGTGDWNDGMNLVGAGGKGESVWLGWFLYAILRDWAALADARGEGERAQTWRAHGDALQLSLERDAWDGDWYRRAYFDDGTPLGSAVNDEGWIDSIAQSWSVLSGAAHEIRRDHAMALLHKHLVRRDDGVVLLLTSPFDVTPFEPGYIKGYLPGIRENGGQYTHAAAWAVMAFAQLGDGDTAMELLTMLNPITHSSTAADIARYKVEPYVVAGDVYGEPPHVGRGGWTWYTGSAGWLYRAGLESILGFRLRGTRLVIDPCIPRGWPGFSIMFRYHAARYDIVVENPDAVSRGVTSLHVDGVPVDALMGIPLVDDKRTHRVHVVLGAASPFKGTMPR